MVNFELQQHLQPYLLPSERLLWAGKPIQGFRLEGKDWYRIPFYMIWCSFAFIWTFMASSDGSFFGLFGVPFIMVGLYMVIGRFFHDNWKRKKEVYGVTNQRILIYEGFFKSELFSLEIENLPPINLIQMNEGKGSIKFGEDVPTGNGRNSEILRAPKFDTIDDVTTVYQLIVKEQKS